MRKKCSKNINLYKLKFLGAGIGTIEAIRKVWTCHREVINDVGPIPKNWTLPKAT